ncbi:MAG: hypothetical protein ACREJD_06145 [Phycisphaerales bacterium]
MSDSSPSIPRSIGAVVAGLVFILVTHTGTDAILHATKVFPPMGERMSDPLFVLAFAYRFIFSIGGCYLTALLAPRRPMKHALILGFVGVILSTAGAVAFWNAVPELGPKWYSVLLVVNSLPAAWLGGKIRELQLKEPVVQHA